MGAILYWLIVGLIAGALAKLAVPGKEPGGMLWSIIIGLLGALLGGFLFSLLGISAGGFFGSTLVAFLGAVVLLFIYHAVRNRRPVS